jgi:hypothetical protein
MAQDPNANDVTPRSRRVPDRTLITLMTVLLLVIVGIFVYRMSTRPAEPDSAGDRSSVDRAGEQLPGGSDPQPKFGSTRDEIENRGGGRSADAVTRLSDITDDRHSVSGQRVELKDVEVESASADSFWIKDGDDKIAVVAPAGTPALRDGQRVSVSGRVEASGDSVRINATRVEVTG